MMSGEIHAAMEAGIRGAFHVKNLFGRNMEELGVEYKPQDGDTPRTLIDRYSEDAILSCLKRRFPNDSYDAEETGVYAGSDGRKWHVDSFDGTSNAEIKLPLSTVGIAFQKGDEAIVGVAVDPFSHLVYAAEKGSGAFEIPYSADKDSCEIFWDGQRRLRVSQRTDPKKRYAEIDGFFNDKTAYRKSNFMRDLYRHAHNMRMTGSNIRSAINLASGGTDIWLIDAVGGFFDIAPGAVLIPEAGGIVTGIEGEKPWNGMQVAIATNNVGDHEQITRLAQKHYQQYKGFR